MEIRESRHSPDDEQTLAAELTSKSSTVVFTLGSSSSLDVKQFSMEIVVCLCSTNLPGGSLGPQGCDS